MTTRTVLFDSPFLLGFDHTRGLIERAQRAATEGYPPYNVEAREGGGLRITLAVAGFSPEQLEVTIEGEMLTVAGKRGDGADSQDRAFLHRGIAARGFLRTFILADGMIVGGATLEHGLLHVDLERPKAERVIQRIPIRAGG
jgi:HSP20 family molecular chaperone IbpA